MWRSEKARRGCARPLDRANSQLDVTTDVERALEVQLAVKVSVVPELMTLVRDSLHKLRPAFGMTAEHEERRAHAFFT